MAFYYYGGKMRLSAFYPRPKHRLIIEPFAGGAAYSVRHLKSDPSLRAVLYEKDRRVYEAWRRILSMTEAEALSMRCPEAGEVSDDFLVMVTMASNASLKCRKLTVTKRMPTLFESQRANILEFIRAGLQERVTIVNADYRDIPGNVEATWFIDPPYEVRDGAKCSNGNGYGKGCQASDLDYDSLGRWCMGRRGQVIVCEKEGRSGSRSSRSWNRTTW